MKRQDRYMDIKTKTWIIFQFFRQWSERWRIFGEKIEGNGIFMKMVFDFCDF